MKWLVLHIDTTPAGLEPVSDMLRDLGIEGLVIEDEGDFRDFLENNRQYWDYVDEEFDRSMAGKCRVTFYLEENEEGFTKVAAVRIALAELKKQHPEYAPLIMTIDGIDASFALLRADDTVTISARSHDKINVQVIMQRLGGGGHYDMAGTRMTHTTLESACQQLKDVLDEYMDNEYETEKGMKRN